MIPRFSSAPPPPAGASTRDDYLRYKDELARTTAELSATREALADLELRVAAHKHACAQLCLYRHLSGACDGSPEGVCPLCPVQMVKILMASDLDEGGK